MSISGTSSDEILVAVVALCGILCIGGYLTTFALTRRLHESGARPMIGLGELLKPLAGGMVLGLIVLGFRSPELLPACLSVVLAGVCGGGWAARSRVGRGSITQADLVRRLCVAGNTHEEATARIAVRLALAAGYDPAGASDLMAAASLHDVGKAGIPTAILEKSAKLDATRLDATRLDAGERRTLQRHTLIGYRMLARSHEPMLDLAADIALHHHEQWDGQGYPAGLAGEHIPLSSRAVALAETFDGLLRSGTGVHEDRVPPTFDEVTRLLHRGAGVLFDPRLVALLLADLPGMVAARDGAVGCGADLREARPAAKPDMAWLRPGRFRPLQPSPVAI